MEQVIDSALEVAKEVAVSAGKMAYKSLNSDGMDVEVKSCSVDLVTAVDKAVEEYIMTHLKAKFPTHRYIGEETTEEGKGLTDEPTWMVDPIDGTTNFVHGFPFSAVSIGFVVNKVPVVGVVYNFNLDHLYAAKKGGGATRNGKPIRVSSCKEPEKALIMSEFGFARAHDMFDKVTGNIKGVIAEPRPCVGMRMLGSAALDMCMVAQGSADAYYEYGIHCWDIAASDVIVREAGGVSMYPTGEPLDVMRRGILCAATPELAHTIQANIVNLEGHHKADS